MVLESALSLSPQQIGPPPTGGSRGYAEATVRVMEALQGGAKAADTGRLARPEGSFGNGGAMRIAPVGLAYRWRPGLTGAWRFIVLNRDCVHEGSGLIRYACTTCMSHDVTVQTAAALILVALASMTHSGTRGQTYAPTARLSGYKSSPAYARPCMHW